MLLLKENKMITNNRKWQILKLYNNHTFHKVRIKLKKQLLKGHLSHIEQNLILLLLILNVTAIKCNKPPRFLIDGHQTEIVLRLKESPATKVDTLIHRLKGYDPNNATLIFGKRSSMDSDVIRIENINNNEALIYLAKELDRETQDEYSIILTLRDNSHLNDYDINYVTQSFVLLVEDINDNAPVFLPYQNTLEVMENIEHDKLITLEATDADEGAYGQVVYYLQELEGDNDLFAISTFQGKGILSLMGQLDYEKKSLYQLRILAVDRANHEPIHTGTAAILIKVQDLDDQPPEFIKVQPIARIAENVPAGTRIMHIIAIDGDHGINNPIVYKLEGSDLFAIEPSTGWIYTTYILDREDPDNIFMNGAYILKITAFEVTRTQMELPMSHSAQRSQIQTEVTIIITDVNDEIPQFAQAFYRCEIMENSQAKTPVNFLDNNVKNIVYDHDLGNNGTFLLFLDPPNDLFEIVPSLAINEANFLLRVNNSKGLDYELLQEINFTIFAREIEEPDRYSSALIQINLRDQNDNFPEFVHCCSYNVSISENIDVGTKITQIQALDKDSGDYGSLGIRYKHLRGGIAHKLHLDPITGIIRTKNITGTIFDRELISQHYLTMEAVDNLGSGNRNTAQLIIEVEDANDNAPRFLYRQYETTLMENNMKFEQPLQLEALDNDLNDTENSQVTYEIVEGLYKDHFTIDPKTGYLRPIKVFDYETIIEHDNRFRRSIIDGTQQIDLLVRARDSGLPMLSTIVPVIIYIKDVNDNRPIFEKSFYTKTIPEDLTSGSLVLQVTAIDNDGSAPNNLIAYRIEDGAADKFVINSESGVISVAQGANLDPNLTDIKLTNYTLTVLALDGGIGNSQLINRATVNILITDVNNKWPIIKPLPLLHIKENSPEGTLLYKIEAHDPDENAIIRYQINAENSEAFNEQYILLKTTEYDYLSAFSLNAINGNLQLQKSIDREKVEHIKLSIIVEDLAAHNGKQIVQSILSLEIDDENDNNPIFAKPFYNSYITENSKSGLTITHISAYDIDKNHTITYYLYGNEFIKELIHLDNRTGEVIVKNRIDYEQHKWLNFTVKAIDSGIPNRSTTVKVHIAVLDENDNNPYFLGSNIKNYTISESAEIGTRIDVMEACDIDSGDFGEITYLMDRLSSHGKFSIDSKTGVLNVADHLDREIVNNYALIIEAWDNYKFGFYTGESRNTFKQIFITIMDENDNAPEIVISANYVIITEYHNLNEKITTIKGTDNDDNETPNGRLKFRITKGNEDGLFTLKQIDPWTAHIYAQISLHNRSGNYSLVILTQDLGQPPNGINNTLNICVSDVNDHAPVFIQPLGRNTIINITENITVNSLIYQIIAEDTQDVGINAIIKYRFKIDPMGSYKFFNIDPLTGNIYLRQPLNRNKHKIHELRIEAYDQGEPTSMSSDTDLTIYVRKNQPIELQFMEREIFINFTEHADPGSERIKLPDAIDKSEIDETNLLLQTCYFIIWGNEKKLFYLDPDTHILMTTRELDREDQAYHKLFVKVTENCDQNQKFSDYKNQPAFIQTQYNESSLMAESPPNIDSNSIISLQIRVVDINDNPPKFHSRIFTGGITTNTDFGTKFMRVAATDLDEGDNAIVKYYIISDIRQTLSEGLEYIKQAPFSMLKDTGEIQLDFDPQKGMKGYFDFMILANDSANMKDIAHVFIYLLREDQKIKFIFRLHPHELRQRIQLFRETLSNITGAIVNVDDIKVHENQDGSVDKTKTDLYMHLVNKIDNSIYEVDEGLKLIDSYIEHLDHLFKELNVLDTQAAESQLLTRPQTQTRAIFIWLIFTNLFLIILLLLTLTLCITQRNNYRRKIRAAQVKLFRNSSSLCVKNAKEIINRVPNTNKHSIQGSNPIWLKHYEDEEWFKTSETLSHSSNNGVDSLDDNILTTTNESHEEGSLKSTIKLSEEQSNDLNGHFNVYKQIDKITNNTQILAASLETTEL